MARRANRQPGRAGGAVLIGKMNVMRRAEQLQKFRTDGNTVSPERLVVLLYERLERDLVDARAAIDAGDAERRHGALLHAQEIVEELSYAVRTDVWDAGKNLVAIYDFVLELLVQANVGPNAAAVDEAATLIHDLTVAWREAYVSLASTAGS